MRSEQIFNHALRYATPFSTTLGHAWAIVPDGFSRYHGWPIRSRRFREWLAHSFHREHGLFPGTHALNSAMQMLSVSDSTAIIATPNRSSSISPTPPKRSSRSRPPAIAS
jgi:hypothetical protein